MMEIYRQCDQCKSGYLHPMATYLSGHPYLFVVEKSGGIGDCEKIVLTVFCDSCKAKGKISYPILSLVDFKEV